MLKATRVQVGDKFVLNCGVEVEVIDYLSASVVVVSDKCGQTKKCSPSNLRRGAVSFLQEGVIKTKKSVINTPAIKINVGDKFTSKNWGDVTVLSDEGSDRFSVKFENTGYISNVSRSSLIEGLVRDKSAFSLNILKQFKPGMIFTSTHYGKYKIIDVLGCNEIYIKWEDNGEINKVRASNLRDNSVSDKTRSRNKSDYLKPKGYYVYVAYHNNMPCYVGFGKNDRYLHCNSGISSCYLLNKYHFEGVVFEIKIVEDNLCEDRARLLEKNTIFELKPSCNKANTAHLRNEIPT